MDEVQYPADVYVSLVEHIPDLVSVMDAQGRVRYVNHAGLAVLGLGSVDEAIGRSWREFFTDEGTVHADAVLETLRAGGAWDGESELRHSRTGESIPISMSSFLVVGEQGPPLIASVARDLRAQHRRDAELREVVHAAAHLAAEQRALAEISHRALHGQLDELLVVAAEAAVTLIGAARAYVLRSVSESGETAVVARAGEGVVEPSAAHSGMSAVPDITADHGGACSVSVPIAGDGGPWGVLTVENAVPRVYSDAEQTFLSTVGDVISAAVRRDALERRLRYRSQHDPLTGLPNRARVHDHLARVLERVERSGNRVAVLLVDFDNFKSINDHFGHDIGDIALVAVAERLHRAVLGRAMSSMVTSGVVPAGVDGTSADVDRVSRLGGDEFLVVCEGVADAADAASIAQSIIADLSVPVTVGGRDVPLGASIGIALSENGIDVSQLVHRADVAMYRAKSASPGTYAVYDASDARQTRHHLTMSTDLRAAIDNDELTVRYAPMVDTRSGEIESFVALPLWDHPALGALPADDFVNTAERTGLIHALGGWILRRVCRDAAAWQRTTRSAGVRIGVVAMQMQHPDFVETVTDAARRAQLSPDRVVISVPESALRVVDDRAVRAVLGDLHARGFRLHLDNSSGGHSSIRNLAHFSEFQYFQLDSSDVDATFREHSAVVLAAVVSLIHAIGARVVAAGVDTAEHLDGIGAVGCDLAMGAVAGGPMTAEEARALVVGSSAGEISRERVPESPDGRSTF